MCQAAYKILTHKFPSGWFDDDDGGRMEAAAPLISSAQFELEFLCECEIVPDPEDMK